MTSPEPLPTARPFTREELDRIKAELRAANPNTDRDWDWVIDRPWTREEHDMARAEQRAADRREGEPGECPI